MFTDYSTYLQTIVMLEKQAHELCNLKKYSEAKKKSEEIHKVAYELSSWLEKQQPGKAKSVEDAARLALEAIELGCSFDYFDSVIGPELRKALGGRSD